MPRDESGCFSSVGKTRFQLPAAPGLARAPALSSQGAGGTGESTAMGALGPLGTAAGLWGRRGAAESSGLGRRAVQPRPRRPRDPVWGRRVGGEPWRQGAGPGTSCSPEI